MKTRILKFSLILCLVSLGLKNADAATVSVTVAQIGGIGTQGLAANPINTSQSGIAIYGFSLTGSNTNANAANVTSLTFNPISTKNNNYFFPTVSLYSSSSSTWGGVSNQTPLATATMGSNSNNFTLTIPGGVSVSRNQVLYYFLVVDYTNDVATSNTLEIDYASGASTGTISGAGTGNTGDKYTYSPFVTNVAAASVGTNGTNGLLSDPISGTETGAIYGLSLTGSGGGPATTINSLAFSTNNQGTTRNNYYYDNVRLYSSTSSTFPGVGGPGVAQIGSQITTGNNTNDLTFTGLNISVASGATTYYFVVIDYNGVTNGTQETQSLDFDIAKKGTGTNATTLTVPYTGSGYNYTYKNLSIAVAANNGAAYAGNLDHDVTNTVLFSYSATPSGTATITGFTITGTGVTNLSTYFSSMTLYSSTQATFPGISTATLVKTITPPNSNSISISGINTSISSKLYYYLVVNYTDPIADNSAPTLQFNLTGVASTATVTGTTVNGGTYTLSSPVTLDNPTFTGIAGNPLSASASNVAVLGFSVTTTQAEAFNKFVLTTGGSPVTTISPYFTGTPALFVNTSPSATGGTAVPSGSYLISGTNGTTITISLTTAQTFSAAGTKYYYLVFPTYTLPSTNANFELDASSVSTSTYTYTNGGPAQGIYYTLGQPVYDWNGSSNAGGAYLWSNPANWSIGSSTATVAPGATSNVRFGTALTYNGTHQPTVTADASVNSITIGYNGGNSDAGGNGTTITVNSGATLTVNSITHNHNANNDQLMLIQGAGNLVCNGDVTVGDATQPSSNDLNVTSITTTITHMTINGNIVLNSNGRGNSNPGNNYPYFGLAANKLTLMGQIKFTANNNPKSFGTGRANDGNDFYQNLARFNMDMTSSPTFLELYNANTIPNPDPNFYVDFTDLKGGSTVTYEDQNANETQMVYTNGTPGLGTNNYNYINLIFAGASKKQVDGDIFSVAGYWNTDGGPIDLSTNAPTVYITQNTEGRNITNPTTTVSANNNWTNSCNVSQGAASILIGNKMINTGNVTCGSGTLEVDGQFTNASGSFLCGSGSVIYEGGYLNSAIFAPGSGTVYFTGTQNLQDNSTTGTTFNDVNFNLGTSTINAGQANFAVSNIGRLFLTNNSKLITGTTLPAYLTLKSDGTSTATVEPISGSSTITGNVNVQRFVTGGALYRGYRLFSPQVNISGKLTQTGTSTTNRAFIDPTYLNSGMLTGGPGGTANGWDVSNFNPLMYLYDDTRPSSATQFYSGKNVGISAIVGGSTNTVVPMSTTGAALPAVQVPVGNSFLVFYAGTTSLSKAAPESTAVTATGTINQGTINVWLFKPSGPSQNLVTGGVASANGQTLNLNQVGNPYPSTIMLSKFYTDNSTHIQSTIYELDPTTGVTGTYLAVNGNTGASSSTNRASNYIVSGQGFWVESKGTNPTLQFKETEKVDYPAITSATTSTGANGGTLLMGMPTTVSNNDIAAKSFAQNTTPTQVTDPAKSLVGLHLQLSKDSVTYTQTGIYFSSQWTDTFNLDDDAIDRDGASPKVYLSSYSSDAKRLCINQLGDYVKGKRIKLYASATTSGQYNITLADLNNIDTVNYNVYLVDNKMSDSLDMTKYKSYAFNINTTDTSTFGANRFVLAVERKALPPYALISFSGQKVSNGVQLFWKTLNEGTYTNFAIQKLGGSNTYSSIYTEQGTGAGIYADVDTHPSSGNNTYRLQQTDINGIVTYSAPVTVNYSARAANGSLTIYPNPSKTIINISLNSNNTGSKNYIADIYNISGTVVAHKTVNADTWTQDITSYKLGVYVIEIKTDTGYLVGQSKFVKVN